MRRILLVAATVAATAAALAVAAPSTATGYHASPWFNGHLSLVVSNHSVPMSPAVWNEGSIPHTGNLTLSLTRGVAGPDVIAPLAWRITLGPGARWQCAVVMILPKGTYTARLALTHVREGSDPVGSLYQAIGDSATVIVN